MKQLWQIFAKQRTTYLSGFQVKATCMNVKLPKTGDVRILFISNGRKQWEALLSTDIDLEASEILKYYARRWAIEVFFKDAKQLLYMGKEQSKTFDATIACHSIVMIRYLLLVYILNKRRLTGSIGSIFNDVVDKQEPLLFAEKIWSYVRDQLLKSIKVISYKIEIDNVMDLLEIIDGIVGRELSFVPAKL